ncbi:N-methyl-L-tryptophan oxidase [Nocardiopsis kunsanensis]|uniref:N-methyltryptophan oxidase n=1 Tax=Nocardiopsis kunsanensis TaxID=141693 RepID=A0A918XCE7_9ACTN|nr:N-methyl-L-tryptophan oxidase [Nocardiopsis kunsanensis]GHD25782.1 N-methyltryptophan oxidase [Nocardiopsis kunsanensis]
MGETLRTDTVVVGLGAMGSQALWHLARRGVPTVGVEQFVPGHDRGSSHGESRIIRTAYVEGAEYVPFVRAAWERWADLEQASGQELLLRTGALMAGAPDSGAVSGALTAASHHALEHEHLSPEQAQARFPHHRFAPGEEAVVEQEGGVLLPEAAIGAAVRLAGEAGARVLTEAPVTRIVPDPEQPTVWMGGTEIRARRVVVAAGSWTTRLLPQLPDLGIRVERRVLGWFPITGAPEPHTGGQVFARDEADGTLWFGFPSLDGRTVKIGVHSEAPGARFPGAQWGEPVDPDTGPRAPDTADGARLGLLAARLDGVATTPERMSACMYTMTPDEDFLIGHRAELPGLVLAGGFSGHGFKFASAVGAALADLAEHGRTDLPIDMFDPQRQ